MDRLSRKVAAVNELHRFANDLRVKMVEVMTPWVGKQVTKADGGLVKRFADSLAGLTANIDEGRITVVRLAHYQTNMDFEVRIRWEATDETWDYHKVSVRVAYCKGGILEEFLPANDRRADYSVETIRSVRAQIKVARAILHEAESALVPFGEYD